MLRVPAIAALCLLAVACENPRSVSVRISVPDLAGEDTPLAGVRVVALPYDRDSVLGSLEAAADTPRPSRAALESLTAEFRVPFTAYLEAAATEERLRARRDALAGGSPDAIRAVEDSLRAVTGRLETSRAGLAAARERLMPAIDSQRQVLTEWETAAFRAYDSITNALVRQLRRQPVSDSTDATGWAHLRLTPGPWWVVARSFNVRDPNAEWYWNVPVPGETDTLRLEADRAERRLR